MGEIGQKLAPEVHKLVTEWDTLPSGEKGELTGYCLGKYGADGVEAQALAEETKAATRVVSVVERSAVEARAGSAVGSGIKNESFASVPVKSEIIKDAQVGNILAKEAKVAEKKLVIQNQVAAAENLNNIVKVGNFKYTETVSKHLNDVVKRGPYAGELSRPYMKSSQIIDEIMAAKKPIPDPGGVPGALRWDVLGTFRGSEGTWELVLHPENGIIYHFNFK